MKLLLQHEASPNVVDSKGSSPLHLAAWAGDAEIVRLILSQGPSNPKVNLAVSNSPFYKTLVVAWGLLQNFLPTRKVFVETILRRSYVNIKTLSSNRIYMYRSASSVFYFSHQTTTCHEFRPSASWKFIYSLLPFLVPWHVFAKFSKVSSWILKYFSWTENNLQFYRLFIKFAHYRVFNNFISFFFSK